MPVYDYLCTRCGPFTEMRPMAEAGLPHKCPTCRKTAPRAFLTAPYLATTGRGPVRVTGERGAPGRPLSAGHGGGCNCCSGRSLRYNKQRSR
ncbi:MAG: FmdB family zinc ribbon protein [Xanthobacteraceae bacterium]